MSRCYSNENNVTNYLKTLLVQILEKYIPFFITIAKNCVSFRKSSIFSTLCPFAGRQSQHGCLEKPPAESAEISELTDREARLLRQQYCFGLGSQKYLKKEFKEKHYFKPIGELYLCYSSTF